MEKNTSVINYEIKQTKLKKEVKKLKKKVPYFFLGFIFFSVILIFLFDGLLNKYVGNSFSFMVLISSIFILIFLLYLFFIFKKIRSHKKEIKELGEKMYDKMKLNSNKNE